MGSSLSSMSQSCLQQQQRDAASVYNQYIHHHYDSLNPLATSLSASYGRSCGSTQSAAAASAAAAANQHSMAAASGYGASLSAGGSQGTGT